MVDTLLHAGAQVFREAGYERASTNLIARVAGVSVGSLYQYFPNKEALARALVDRIQAGLLERMRELIERSDDAASTTAAIVDAVIELHEQHPGLVGLVLSTQGPEGDQHLPDAVAVVRALIERHRADVDVDDTDTAAWVLVHAVDALLSANALRPRVSRATLRKECLRLAYRYVGIDVARAVASEG